MPFIVSKVANNKYTWALVEGTGVFCQAWQPFTTVAAAVADVQRLQAFGGKLTSAGILHPPMTLTISPQQLADGQIGVPYSQTLGVSES